jgi:endo-alpha-1,4-polygalactosaminidase (GH114 family)
MAELHNCSVYRVVTVRSNPISLLKADGELQMDEQLKSRFEHVLQQYAEVIKERDAALLREKTAREQFEVSFRSAVDNVILPAAAQVKELVARTHWVCLATKTDNGLSAKVEIYQGNMKAATGERPHIKLLAASKANDVQIYVTSQSSAGSKQTTMKVEEITEPVVQQYLLALIEKLVAEGPPDNATRRGN